MSDDSPFQDHPDGVLIDIVVQPRASRSEIVGIHAGALRVRVAAPPVDGAANDAVVELLRKSLNVRKADIHIISGSTARRKRVLVHGYDARSTRAALLGQSNQ